MSGIVELKPCPFDGGTCDPELIHVVRAEDTQGREGISSGYVECGDCGARGPTEWASADEFHEVACYSWNSRAPDPSLAQAEARGMEKAAGIAEAMPLLKRVSPVHMAAVTSADIASAIRAASRLALQESRDGE